MRRWILAALAASVLLLPGCAAEPRAQAATGTPLVAPAESVTAVGTGEVAAAPDRARLDFSAQVKRDDAQKALREVSGKAERIAKALRAAGIAKTDIRTTNLNMYPERTPSGTVNGYQASITVQVEVRDVERIGKLIVAATKAGATDFSGPAFYLSKDNQAHDQAIDAAVADAERRAELMAKASGRKVGAVITLTEAPMPSGPIPFAGGVRMEKAAMDSYSVPVEQGTVQAMTQVTVTFELK